MSASPRNISPVDRVKLIAVYKRLCPDDPETDDDPRKPVIAAEVVDVASEPSIKAALEVIECSRQPAA